MHKVLDSGDPMEKNWSCENASLRSPTYYVFSGLVFTTLTRHWLVCDYFQRLDSKPLLLSAICFLYISKTTWRGGGSTEPSDCRICTWHEDATDSRVRRSMEYKFKNFEAFWSNVVESSKEEFEVWPWQYTSIVLEREKCWSLTKESRSDQIGKHAAFKSSFLTIPLNLARSSPFFGGRIL